MNINEGNINFRHIIILTTTPTLEDARKICRELVEAMLVACATTVSGVESTFRWKNQVNQEKEHLVLMKTRSDLFNAVMQRIKDIHPYEAPEIIARPIIQGCEPYLKWIDENTRSVGLTS